MRCVGGAFARTAECPHPSHAATQAVCVGPSPSSLSYLNMDRIIEACKATGAQAVHPGYGFLSENHLFADRLAAEGIKFIGPGNEAITAMGDKITSKKIASEAKVNVIPGFMGLVEDNEEVKRIANEIGYPVMIKASAGGGGKGMRIAYNDEEAVLGFRLSKEEAKASFGDDRIFIEKFIEEPRHIEIQLLADQHGNVVAFPERECSIQRRNQKVVEEAPSVLLDPATRKAMGEQACALARAVGYESAGTVEFLCDKHKNFFFLEMNTRLQVEHPITEYVSGVDLVENMIRVAAGHPLPADLVKAWEEGEGGMPILGHAFESRVYAEDPVRGFLPSTGRLSRYIEPTPASAGVPEDEATPDVPSGVGGVRVDSAVGSGSEISMFYDPMICKLVTHGPDRDTALEKMRHALDAYVIAGVGNNLEFLRHVADHPRFVSGKITTGFIAEEYPEGFYGYVLGAADRSLLGASAAVMRVMREEAQAELSGQVPTATPAVWAAPALNYFVTLPAEPVSEAAAKAAKAAGDAPPADEVVPAVVAGSFGEWEVVLGEGDGATTYAFSDVDWSPEAALFTAQVAVNGGEPTRVQLQHTARTPEGFQLKMKGAQRDIKVRSPRAQALAKHMPVKEKLDLSTVLVSPMPGTLVSLAVKEGDIVQPGQELAVVEAMKMQNVLRAPKKALVKSISAKAGDVLAVDQVILGYGDDE